MDRKRKLAKRILRQFLMAHYSDSDLVFLLDSARIGTLEYASCCCFIGIPTRDASQNLMGVAHLPLHLDISRLLFDDAYEAEMAFKVLGRTDVERRRRIIPVVLAEIRRRTRARVGQSNSVEYKKAEREMEVARL
jgi:hypothetical protein